MNSGSVVFFQENTDMNIFFKNITVLLIFFFLLPLSGAQLTIRDRVTIEVQGFADSGDPVEAFENAIRNGKIEAAGLIAAEIRGGSSVVDGVLSDDWVEKRANIQVFDVKLLEKEFLSEGAVRVKLRMIAGYLDARKFWTEYYKTVKGAIYRTAVIPGLGQAYNREYTSSVLYGAFYWAFYGLYMVNITRQDLTQPAVNRAFARYQLPSFLFWTLSVSDAGISRIMLKFGLEQVKESYRAGIIPEGDRPRVVMNCDLIRYRF